MYIVLAVLTRVPIATWNTFLFAPFNTYLTDDPGLWSVEL